MTIAPEIGLHLLHVVVHLVPGPVQVVPPVRAVVPGPQDEVRVRLDLLQVLDGREDQLLGSVAPETGSRPCSRRC